MSSNKTWLARQRRIGWTLGVAAVVVGVTGLALQAAATGLPFDPRLVTGLGIVLLGLAIAALMRGGVASRAGDTSTRLGVEELDERNVAIRRFAGNRAFVVSVSLTYALLMWVSFAANGQLPVISPDGLWYALTAAVVLPLVVYVVSVVQAERSM
jgi:ABC-type uncharacterized transport system permease subunit